MNIKNRESSNGFYVHSRRNKEHKPDWSKTVLVEKEKHWKARKLKAAVLVNAVNPTKNARIGGIMNCEKGCEMDLIWSSFNEIFREMLNKKVREW